MMKTWGEKHGHEPERKTGEIRKVYLTNMTSVVSRNNCRILVANNSQVTRAGNRSKGGQKCLTEHVPAQAPKKIVMRELTMTGSTSEDEYR